MNTLPPELIAAVLALCPGYSPAARAVCRSWRALAPASLVVPMRQENDEDRRVPPPVGDAATLRRMARSQYSSVFRAVDTPSIRQLARDGHEDLLLWVYGNVGGQVSAEAVNSMLWGATEGGHERLYVLARGWGAGAGAIHSMIYLATKNNNMRMCVLAKEWGASADDVDQMLGTAAYHGNERLCALAKEWGAAGFNKMLHYAAMGGHERTCRLAKEWGATDFSWMLHTAISYHRGHLLILAEAWMAERAGA